jgi:hypothetical protein
MPSNLTRQERQLIDEAIAEGKVTKIARGQSAFTYKWDPMTAKIVRDQTSGGQLRFNGGRHPKVTDTILRRRALVRKYQEEGLSLKAITERLQSEGWDIQTSSIRGDLKILDLTAVPHGEYLDKERLRLFWKYFNDGVYRHKDLAALMELSEHTLQKFLRRHGIRITDLRTAPAGSQKTGPHKSGSVPE